MQRAVAPINYGNIVSGSNAVPTNGSYFYARFTGLLVPLVTGLYTVGVNCQDGCNLFIGDQELVGNLSGFDTANGSVEYTEFSPIYLCAGIQYPITIEWAVGVGGASVGYELQLIWTPPATSTPVLIPATCLTNDTTSITGVLDSSWWNGTPALYYPTGNAAIDFANTQHFNKTLDYISDGLTRRILGGSGGFGAATAATATANVATAPADDVLIADGHGNVEDSGVLLSSLVTASELSSYGFFVNPMTASGDMIYEDPSLGPMRLPIGAEGYVMTVVSGLPAWTAATWDSIGSAQGNLTLNNGAYSTTFNQSDAAAWLWANTTSATDVSGTVTNQSSPILSLAGEYWNGSASATDTWSIQDVVGAGTNPTSTLNITHSGTSGVIAFKVHNIILTGGLVVPVNIQTGASYTPLVSDSAVIFTYAGNVAVTLNSSLATGTVFRCKNKTGAGNSVTYTPSSGNIDGAPTLVDSVNNHSVDLVFDGTNWNIF